MFVEPVESYPRIGIFFQLYTDTHPISVGFIAYSRYAFYSFILYQFSYLFQQSRFVYLKRYLADYYLRTASVCLLYFRYSPDGNLSLSRPVGLDVYKRQ